MKGSQRDLQVKFISFHDQIADIFTKGFPSPCFHWLTSKLIWTFPFRLREDESTSYGLEEIEEGRDTVPMITTPKTVLTKMHNACVSQLEGNGAVSLK